MKVHAPALALALLSMELSAQTSGSSATPLQATGVVSGIVVNDADPPHPVTRAIVTLTGDGLSASRTVLTDDSGRFRVSELPPGRFTIKVEKPSFVTSFFGAKRPARPGTAVVLKDGENSAHVVLRIWRGAVVAGVIRDSLGRPARGVTVRAIRAGNAIEPLAPVLTNNGVSTNQLGEFRIFGLEPGTYAVSATVAVDHAPAGAALTDTRIDELLALLQRGQRTATVGGTQVSGDGVTGYADMFYPGTTNIDQATPLTLKAGQEATGVDFQIQPVPMSSVSGAIVFPDGSPAPGAIVQVRRQGAPTTSFAAFRATVLSANGNASGAFKVSQLTPGTYLLTARRRPQTPAGATQTTSWASTDLTVSGKDVAALRLTVEPAIVVNGRVLFEQNGVAVPLPKMTGNIVVTATEVDTGVSMFTVTLPDGTFALPMPPGRSFRLSTNARNILDSTWAPPVAIKNGRDLLEVTTPIPDGELVLTFTNRHTELTGKLETASGSAVSDVFVIAFTPNTSFWGSETRRVQAVRPAADGSFLIRDLPPGEYFLGAVTDVDAGDWLNADFLAAVVGASTKVVVTADQRTIQNLRIGR